ncbi:MAG: hypothetical protein GY724_30490 [Actinomycetia bacterium]|nr:hypothetical protein [Actinomycetes bacterium]
MERRDCKNGETGLSANRPRGAARMRRKGDETMSSPARAGRRMAPFLSNVRSLASGYRLEWYELGILGRFGLVGIIPAALLAVGLGFSIQDVARSDLLNSRASILAQAVDDLPMEISPLEPGSAQYEDFSSAVALRLLGNQTVRVKLWAPDGTIVYSDATLLVGERFDVPPDLQKAFGGIATFGPAHLDRPDSLYDLELGRLMEFYLPVRSSSGEVVGVFEVYERAASFEASLASIRGAVWWRIGIGLFILGIFLIALTTAIARALNRRRRLAEDLADSVAQTRDEERRRIVNALHDDVSQPLYRILFGLQGCRQRVADTAVAEEMAHLETVARDIEVSIRSQLRYLHGSAVEEIGLISAVEHLVELTRDETDLVIHLQSDDSIDLEVEGGSVMYRAVQESLFNVRRHAGATQVSISLRVEGRNAIAYVADDGIGWNGKEGIGLATTRQLLRGVDGNLKIERSRPNGTRLRIRVPIEGLP